MRFSAVQLRLLAELELQGALAPQTLAKRVRSSAGMVRYHIRRFIELGVMSPRQPIIDMHGLGYTHYTIFLGFHSYAQKTIEAIVEFLSTLAKVTWIFELGTEYQLAFTISARAVDEVSVTIEALRARFPRAVCERSIVIQSGFTYFGRRYLFRSRAQPAPDLHFRVQPASKEADSVDLKILSAMANGSEASVTEVARLTGQSLPTVSRRIKAMEDRKVICGYFHWLHAEVLSRTCYLVRLRVRGFASELQSHLKKFAQETPELVFIVECVGNWDYELGIEVPNEGGLIPILRHLHELCGDKIHPAQSSPILRYHKFRSFPISL